MCGSGVFPIEAGLMGKNRAPGLHRDFAFTRWACFRKRSWEYLLREAAKLERDTPDAPILGRDRDPGALRAAEENLRRTGMEGRVVFETADFFETKAPFDRGMLALNPPYGKRVPAGSEPAKLYREIGRKMRADYKRWRVLILVPDWKSAQALDLKPRKTVRLDHGGFRVQAVLADAWKGS
jgi:putative N6-adenine-specific DNA methylase